MTTLEPTLDQEFRSITNQFADSCDDTLLAVELDAIANRIRKDLGADDALYIHRMIAIQRRLDLAGRVALAGGFVPPLWFAGVTMLGAAKILENMEIGHNVMHGQWDWMRDPNIHSTTWEWDNACPSSQWKHSHNYLHHQWTNVLGMDRDVGYGLMRVNDEQKWRPKHRFQPASFIGLALLFQYGVALHDIDAGLDGFERAEPAEITRKLKEVGTKIVRQATKDYLLWPALAAPLGPLSVVSMATGAVAANLIRNVWSFAVIFCGHFPDNTHVFTKEEVEHESRGAWYRRQILGSANFTGGRLTDIMSGNLNHQIEHHLFPDLPSNRYAEIAPEVQAICQRHGLPYNTGSMRDQFTSVIRKVMSLRKP